MPEAPPRSTRFLAEPASPRNPSLARGTAPGPWSRWRRSSRPRRTALVSVAGGQPVAAGVAAVPAGCGSAARGKRPLCSRRPIPGSIDWLCAGRRSLCRYVTPPPLAPDRLSLAEDGNVVYRVRHPWRNGKTAVVLGLMTFLYRLAQLPQPRRHGLTYHGALAPAANKHRPPDRGPRPAARWAVSSGRMQSSRAGRRRGRRRSAGRSG